MVIISEFVEEWFTVKKKYPVTIRNANLSGFQSELRIIHDIYNDSMTGHWGFSPASWEEFCYLADDLKKLIDPSLVLIAEYKGEPAGFLLALPNFNEVFIKIRDGKLFPWGIIRFLTQRKNIKTARVISMGLKKKFNSLSLGGLFYSEISRRIVERGIDSAEMSWVMEDNVLMNRAAGHMGGRIHKTYRIFRKSIA